MRRRTLTKQTIPSKRSTIRKAQVRRELARIDAILRRTEIMVEYGRFTDPTREGHIVFDHDDPYPAIARIRIEPFWHITSVFAHELFHLLDPTASEDAVCDREALIAYHASPGQVRRLYARLQHLWLASMAKKWRRGERVPPCPCCGQDVPPTRRHNRRARRA